MKSKKNTRSRRSRRTRNNRISKKSKMKRKYVPFTSSDFSKSSLNSSPVYKSDSSRSNTSANKNANMKREYVLLDSSDFTGPHPDPDNIFNNIMPDLTSPRIRNSM